ncbi:MAG: endonuclease/exonuclease/phosphatase family protein [Woeseiaceae bacterium]|nr:endonuclease/exonuclease/phosphatase family protein [Woeseiaceae bacterium]
MNKLKLAIGAACLTACTSDVEAPPETVSAASVSPVSIMAFNVENLFDTSDDASKDDKTFLPLAMKQDEAHIAECNEIEVDRWRRQCLEWDWNEEALAIKLERVASAILQVNDGRGPDIVALQEVENLSILERLRVEHLEAAGYGPAILLEGQDLRGIDVAFLSRLPLAGEPVLHDLRFDDNVPRERQQDTRGVLQADFELPDGTTLTGLSVHFPAPFHPTEMREVAYRHLNAIKRSLPDNRPTFAAGDFNTTSVENADKDMFGRFVRDEWTIAHEVGCEGCLGTSYFQPRDDWSFLDMVIWSDGDGWTLDANSVAIPKNAPEQSRELEPGILAPKRFDTIDMSGISDHYPILVTISRTGE